MAGALDGIRVLDFSQLMAGPFCTMLLGDLGADVIKVEPPEGDTMRKTSETFLGKDAVFFLSLNRNKRSVIIDLKTEAGKKQAQELAASVDIVVENFRPGLAERLGIGYEELSKLNPRLIYCSISAFGREGPNSTRPGMDPVIQAMSGLMQLNGDDRSGPLKTGLPFSDLVPPFWANMGILAALNARHTTGKGQRVDVSMLNATIVSMIPRDTYYFVLGETPPRIGNSHYGIVPFNTYETSDGRQLMVIAHTDKFWKVVVDVLGLPELAVDPLFLTKTDRVKNRAQLDERVGEVIRQKPLSEWETRFDGSGAMYSPVRSFEEVFSDPQVQKDLVVEIDHPDAGRFKVLANPIQMSDTPASIRMPPPMLGQHTDEILGALKATGK